MSHAAGVGRVTGTTDANTNTIPVEGEESVGVIFNLLIRGTALALGGLRLEALKELS